MLLKIYVGLDRDMGIWNGPLFNNIIGGIQNEMYFYMDHSLLEGIIQWS